MTEEELDAFLDRHETGVLALAHEQEPYAVPVSFGYDATDQELFLRLLFSPGSDKRQFLSATSRACFVVYEETPELYRSVIAIGSAREIPPEDQTSKHVRQYSKMNMPSFDLWGVIRPEADIFPQDLEVHLYKLEPDRLSGHQFEFENPTSQE